MTADPQLRRLGLFNARVPRYTSYPTAPHFSGAVGPSDFTSWIEAIPGRAGISLYIHVPFCRRLCWFCACRTQGTASNDPVIAYARTLRDELALLARHLPRGVKLSRLHWGGGTPTMLPADEIRRLADAVFALVPMAEGGEFSVEIDPGEVDDGRLDALAAAGMNRASIGVQDFDPEIQKTIGREQSYDLTREIADKIRARGVRSLNVDVLYGLPHQDKARIASSVEKVITLSPDRVALYGYAHVPWMSRRQSLIPSEALPGAEARLELYETARRLFVLGGYAEIGIDHFSRAGDGLAIAQEAGRLRRNFQGYTDDTAAALVGLGASSISRLPQGYAQNAPQTAAYTKAIREGRFSTHRGHVFAGEDQLRARIIEALMCDFKVEGAALARDFGVSGARIDALFAEAASGFEDLTQVHDGVFSIADKGRPLTRMIASAFDAYEQSKAQHSAAI